MHKERVVILITSDALCTGDATRRRRRRRCVEEIKRARSFFIVNCIPSVCLMSEIHVPSISLLILVVILCLRVIKNDIRRKVFRESLPEGEPFDQDIDIDSSLHDICLCAILSKRSYRPPGAVQDAAFIREVHGERYANSLTIGDVRYFEARHKEFGLEDTDAYAWVSSDEHGVKTAYVVFRGTENWRDMMLNLDIRRVCIGIDGESEVHSGFLRQFSAVESEIFEYLKEKENDYDRIVFTGHSLGGALATIASCVYIIKRTKSEQSEQRPVYCFTFGAPRVGNTEFVNTFENLIHKGRVKHWRVYDYEDPVPMVPISSRFQHVGDTTLCLGNGIDYVTFGTGCDVPNHERPIRNALALNAWSPLRAHAMTRYIDKLKRLESWNLTTTSSARLLVRGGATDGGQRSCKTKCCAVAKRHLAAAATTPISTTVIRNGKHI